MSVAALLRQVAAPARATGRGLVQDLTAAGLAAVLALTGGGFLIAAGFGVLARALGPLVAATLVGLVLLVLAGLVLWVRQVQRRRQAVLLAEIRAAAEAARDPLPGLVFDLAYMAGQMVFARRR